MNRISLFGGPWMLRFIAASRKEQQEVGVA